MRNNRENTRRNNNTKNQLFTKNEKNLYKGLLQDSDNGIAEALLLMISKKQKFNC